MRSIRIPLAPLALAVFAALSSCSSTASTSVTGSSSAASTVGVESVPPLGSGTSAGGTTGATRSSPTDVAGGTTVVEGVNPNAPEVHEVGDIPDNQVFVPYSTSTGLYTVSYPEGWARTGDGDAVSFTDKLNAIEIAVVTKPVAPTVASVTAVDMAAIAAKSTNFTMGKVSTVTRKGGSAVLATYQIDSAPNTVTGKSIRVAVERYEFWKNGKSVVITLIGAVGADNVDPWKTVTDSFGWAQ